MIVFMGDPQPDKLNGRRYDYSDWIRLLDRAFVEAEPSASKSSVLILGGDLVNRSGNDREWNEFVKAIDTIDPGIRILAAPGNSDWRRFSNICKLFELPADGPQGYEHNFYSYDTEEAHIQVLDSNLMDTTDEMEISIFRDWIFRDLEGTDRSVTMVVSHHPFWPPGIAYEDDIRAEIMRENYLPIFIKKKVDLMLCGHQHLYCRRRSLSGEPVQIIGVSGSKLFKDNDPTDMVAFAEEISVATVLEIAGDVIGLNTIDHNGISIDRAELVVKKKSHRDSERVTDEKTDPKGKNIVEKTF